MNANEVSKQMINLLWKLYTPKPCYCDCIKCCVQCEQVIKCFLKENTNCRYHFCITAEDSLDEFVKDVLEGNREKLRKAYR